MMWEDDHVMIEVLYVKLFIWSVTSFITMNDIIV